MSTSGFGGRRRELEEAFFREHDEDLLVYLATNTSSRKVRQMQQNPAVAVYYCDPGTFRGVQLSGAVEMVSDSALKRRLWQDGWETYFPTGVDDPDYTVLRLRPESAAVKLFRLVRVAAVRLELRQ